MQLPIYLDYSATTPVDPRVAEKMMTCLTTAGNFGNPASRSHLFGWKAEEAVENGRRQVADLINADPREIVWTSGATESDNLAIKGAAHFYSKKGKHIITSKIEHKAVLDPCRQLEREGFDVTYLDPNADGIITPEAVEQAMRDDTVLVSIMHANNEVGTIQPIAAIAERTERALVLPNYGVPDPDDRGRGTGRHLRRRGAGTAGPRREPGQGCGGVRDLGRRRA